MPIRSGSITAGSLWDISSRRFDVINTDAVLQIPVQWWLPTVANDARAHGSIRSAISLKRVIELQIQANPDIIWLPKYLLVVYQLSM